MFYAPKHQILITETTNKTSRQLVFDSRQLVCHCNSTLHPSVCDAFYLKQWQLGLKLNSTQIRMNHC